MAPLKLSNPFRRTAAAPSLKARAVTMKSDLLNLTSRPTLPGPLPAPGSPEAVEAWRRACTEFDRLTALSDAEYAALRIGDSFTLWTTEWVEAAQRGDFARFSTREMPAARAKTAAELADLLVIAARRDLQFAEARRQTGIRDLYALAYPNGEDPAAEPDPIHAAIAESHRAEDAVKAFGLDPASTARPEPLAGAALRAHLEETGHAAFDIGQQVIDLLDRMDGDADHEDGGDAEPSLAAPENATGSQVTWLRGNDQDREAEAPETVLPEVATEPQPEAVVLPWRGRGNVIAAAGTLLIDLMMREG
ncbi:hypothetical protein MKK75_06605 [Methylobacterium sp. J-030]|uniref:hypothetical protein n=1 Tax=Methylobacterium sp. J-030 TaxID=2836627 RepID=UPI001FB97580|nr:hypothetical protein [Methylobacterium sp. J-030]MCJ2068479.1 hypothetical protein [Methylobacterium sp. J-030]